MPLVGWLGGQGDDDASLSFFLSSRFGALRSCFNFCRSILTAGEASCASVLLLSVVASPTPVQNAHP